MNKTILIYFSLFIILSASAQVKVSSNFKTTFGNPYKIIGRQERHYFTKGDEILAIKIKGRHIATQKINSKTLSLIQKKELKDFFPSGAVLEEVAEFGGKYYVFYNVFKYDGESLYCREIDFSTGEPVGDEITLLFADKVIPIGRRRMPLGTFGSKGGLKYAFSLSSDRSNLLITYLIDSKKKRSTSISNVFGMRVFKANMKLVWNKNVTMPYAQAKMENISFLVDDSSNSYMLLKVYEDNYDVKKQPNAWHIQLAKIAPKSDKIKSTKLEIKDKFIRFISAVENKNNQILCTGYYSNEVSQLYNTHGIFEILVGKDGKLVRSTTTAISQSVLNSFVDEKQVMKNNGVADLPNLVIRNLNLQSDGSLVLIGEQCSTGGNLMITPYGYSKKVNFSFNNILAAKIDANGKLVWMHKLAKSQSGTRNNGALGIIYDQAGLSYKYIQSNGNHYMVYMDNIKNLDLPLNQNPYRHTNGMAGYLTAYKIIDSSGDVSKMSLFNSLDVHGHEVFQFDAGRVISTRDDEFVVELYKKAKEDVLIKVEITK